MARFDLYRPKRGAGYLLGVQSHFLDVLPSRVVVPLVPEAGPLPPIRGLNPVFVVEGERVTMMTQYLASLPRRELGLAVGNLADQQDEITRALDVLHTGV